MVRLGPGQYTVTIRQAGYTPIKQVVDIRSIQAPVLEVKVVLIPQTQETVSVEANDEEIAEQASSPGESIKPKEANESPLRPLTLTAALPLVPGVVLPPNGQTQIQGAGEMHSALIVDSVDSGDPATGRFGLIAPIDVVDSVHVLMSPYLAQYGRFTAGVVTAETRSGGNKWHYDLNDPLPTRNMVISLELRSPRAFRSRHRLLSGIFCVERYKIVKRVGEHWSGGMALVCPIFCTVECQCSAAS